jgi:hypothetical protein
VRQTQALSGIVTGGAVALLATQPVWAAATQVTAVRLNPSESELKLVLETQAGDKSPEIYTASRGNDLVADIVNTQLSLREGDSFRQENPMPGITSVLVSQVDANSVRVTVSGSQNPPTGQVLQSEAKGITLGISTAAKDQAKVPNPVSAPPKAPVSAADTYYPHAIGSLSATKGFRLSTDALLSPRYRLLRPRPKRKLLQRLCPSRDLLNPSNWCRHQLLQLHQYRQWCLHRRYLLRDQTFWFQTQELRLMGFRLRLQVLCNLWLQRLPSCPERRAASG